MPPDSGSQGDHSRRGGKDREAESQQLQEANKEGEAAGPSSTHRDHTEVGPQKEGHQCYHSLKHRFVSLLALAGAS